MVPKMLVLAAILIAALGGATARHREMVVPEFVHPAPPPDYLLRSRSDPDVFAFALRPWCIGFHMGYPEFLDNEPSCQNVSGLEEVPEGAMRVWRESRSGPLYVSVPLHAFARAVICRRVGPRGAGLAHCMYLYPCMAHPPLPSLCSQAISWWLEDGPEDTTHVLQNLLITAYNHYPNSFFSFLNVFLCITPNIEDAFFGTADQCENWFNPHLRSYMSVDLPVPEPIGAQHWHMLSQFYIKGRLGAASWCWQGANCWLFCRSTQTDRQRRCECPHLRHHRVL